MTTDAGGHPVRPQPDGSDVRPLAASELPQVAGAVAQAFYEDPVFSWIFRDEDRRLDRLERGFGLWARSFWLRHELSFTTDHLIGGCFWMPPGEAKLGVLEQVRVAPAMLRLAGGDIVRLGRALDLIDKNHPKDPHYYLPVIGVHPDWQGRGFGAALLHPVLERCDSERMPAYLEASSDRNRALYERHGFKVTDELSVADSPPLWPMWREPHGPVAGG